MLKPTPLSTVLELCEHAYKLAFEEYDDARKNRREFQGVLPKRKHPAWRIFARIRKRFKLRGDCYATPDYRSLKMIIAAYDKGLYDRHKELEAPYIGPETLIKTLIKTK